MVTPELLNFIRTESTRGVGNETIVAALVSSGWPEQDVNDAFTTLTPPPTTQQAPPTQPDKPREPVVTETSVPPALAPVEIEASNLTQKAAKIEIAYDSAVEKVSELGGAQRQVITDAVKVLEEQKIAEIKKRLTMP